MSEVLPRLATLYTEIARTRDLPELLRAAMYDLYQDHYEATSRDIFLSDFAEKEFVLIVRDRNGVVRGFTTAIILKSATAGKMIRAIFSGDTIMHREYWGHQDLAFNWIRFAGRIKSERPDVPLYWFLIVKGHRTYRYLTAFSINFFPHWQRRTPDEAHAVITHLARQRFGVHFDENRGIIHFPASRGHLRADLAAVSEIEARRPDVRFFLERNPGYAAGDELVCLTELEPNNLKPIARRLFLQGFAQ